MSDKTAENKLKSIPGEQIRRQYFNVVIYPLLSFVLLVLTMCVITWFGEGAQDEKIEDLATWMVVLLFVAIPLLPLIVLSILNRFCFGELVCVLNDKGLYFCDCCDENGKFVCEEERLRIVKWEHIRKVSYQPDTIFSGKYSLLPCVNSAHITTKPDKNKKEIVVELDQAPVMLLRKMKKYCPDAKYGFTGWGWVMIATVILIPTVIPAVIVFMG